MLAEVESSEYIQNEFRFGHFQIVAEAHHPENDLINIANVPAIKPLSWKDFEERNLKKGIPVVAHRYGSRGMCTVIANQAVLDVRSITRRIGDQIGLNMYDQVISNEDKYKRVDIDGYVSYSDRIPTQIVIEGFLKDGVVPFSARIFYVPFR